MAISLRKNKGQGIAVEYVLTFFVVAAVVSGMSIYFRRTVQGRIRDAREYMVRTVQGEYSGTLYSQYEPYYSESTAQKEQNIRERRSLLPLSPGKELAEIDYGDMTRIRAYSITLPPVNAEISRIPCYTSDASSCD